MQIVWLSIILVMILGLTILMVFRRPKLSKIESFDDFLSSITAFTNGQEKYYADQLTKEIPVNPGIDYGRISPSIHNASFNNVPASKRFTESLSNRLYTDSTSKFTEADAKFCRGASHPSKLPARPPNATVACGWWYIDDLSTPSVGILGTRHNAMFPTSVPVGGKYIWDIPTASKLEDIKRCKQITNCSVIDVQDLQGKCGFCPDRGHAIPTNSNGTEKYPGTMSCDADLILSSQNCPIIPPAWNPTNETVDDSLNAIAIGGGGGGGEKVDDSADGQATFAPVDRCRSLGRPSDDSKLRLYTEDECAQLDSEATHFRTGECIRVDGGSFSKDCNILNTPTPPIISVCDPDDNGILSRECLLSLSKGMGYTSGGAIVAMLTDPRRKMTDLDAIAIQILTNIGVSIPAALYGSGDIDLISAKELYYKIMLACSQGTKELYRQAANWLVYGSKDFNPCDLEDDVRGPFFAQCIQQEFRKAGCQPGGAAYPKTLDQFGQFSNSKWANVKTQFADLYSSLSDEDGDVQDKAVQNCLGIDVPREPTTACPELVGMWQIESDNDAVRAMYNLRITQRDGGFYVEGWSGTGEGEVEYDKERQRGIFYMRLYDNDAPFNVPFSYNPNNNTLYWDAKASKTPFKKIN
jgi:hypothetical protein